MQPILILAGAPVSWLDRSAGEVASSIVDLRGPDGIIAVGASPSWICAAAEIAASM